MRPILPPAPTPNEPLRAAWGIQLLRWCRANTLLPVPGMLLTRTASGTSYRPVATARPGSGVTLPYAFDLTVKTNDEGDDDGATANFEPGTVNQLAPDNVLEDVDVPTGDLSYAFVRVMTDGASVQSCKLMISTDAPDDQVPALNSLPTQVDVVVALIDYTAPVAPATVGIYTPYRCFYPRTNIILTPVVHHRVSVQDPEPGKLPYDIFYVWEATGTNDYYANGTY